jgi:SAM-dependent methyltransferase
MRFSKLLPKPIRRLVRFLADQIPLKVEVRPVRRDNASQGKRCDYQRSYVNFEIGPNDKVLDVGCGGDPFPLATFLVDRYLEPTPHRHGSIVCNGKPLVSADIHNLPFANKTFDFVYCAHILEHTEDPLKACAELMRIGKRGYVETPAMGDDVLFAWAGGRHKWHVVGIAQTLCFFEYTPRQLEGIGSSAFEDVVMDRRFHPLQNAYLKNRDLFNVMFEWVGSFSVYVFHLNGKVGTLNSTSEDS